MTTRHAFQLYSAGSPSSLASPQWLPPKRRCTAHEDDVDDDNGSISVAPDSNGVASDSSSPDDGNGAVRDLADRAGAAAAGFTHQLQALTSGDSRSAGPALAAAAECAAASQPADSQRCASVAATAAPAAGTSASTIPAAPCDAAGGASASGGPQACRSVAVQCTPPRGGRSSAGGAAPPGGSNSPPGQVAAARASRSPLRRVSPVRFVWGGYMPRPPAATPPKVRGTRYQRPSSARKALPAAAAAAAAAAASNEAGPSASGSAAMRSLWGKLPTEAPQHALAATSDAPADDVVAGANGGGSDDAGSSCEWTSVGTLEASATASAAGDAAQGGSGGGSHSSSGEVFRGAGSSPDAAPVTAAAAAPSAGERRSTWAIAPSNLPCKGDTMVLREQYPRQDGRATHAPNGPFCSVQLSGAADLPAGLSGVDLSLLFLGPRLYRAVSGSAESHSPGSASLKPAAAGCGTGATASPAHAAPAAASSAPASPLPGAAAGGSARLVSPFSRGNTPVGPASASSPVSPGQWAQVRSAGDAAAAAVAAAMAALSYAISRAPSAATTPEPSPQRPLPSQRGAAALATPGEPFESTSPNGSTSSGDAHAAAQPQALGLGRLQLSPRTPRGAASALGAEAATTVGAIPCFIDAAVSCL